MAQIGLAATVSLDVDTAGSASQEGAYTALTEICVITVPAPEVSFVDSTNLSNTVRTCLPGLVDSGEFSIEQNYNKADLTILKTHEGVLRHWKIVSSPNSASAVSTWTMTAFNRKTEITLDTEAVVKMKTTIKISGVVTHA